MSSRSGRRTPGASAPWVPPPGERHQRDDRHFGRRLARCRQGPGAPVRLRLHLAGILQGGALLPHGRQLRRTGGLHLRRCRRGRADRRFRPSPWAVRPATSSIASTSTRRPTTLKLASSSDHSPLCLNFSMPYEPVERQAARIRSDVSYYETTAGGGVFSAGSMCWCPAAAAQRLRQQRLAHHGERAAVARLRLRRSAATWRGAGGGGCVRSPC